MNLTLIAGAVIIYLLLMFFVNRIFEKFFRMFFLISTILFFLALMYIVLKGS